MREPEEGVVEAHARRAQEHDVTPAQFLDGVFRCDEFAKIAPTFISEYVEPTTRLYDHSQSGEVSFLVKELVNEVAIRKFFVDVGARGRDRSNSYDILRCFGWRGLLVEANPNLIDSLHQDFSGLDATIVNCAVAKYDGQAEFFFGVNDDVSSLIRHNSEGWGKIRGQCTVPVRQLSSILLENAVPFDFDVLSMYI